MGSSISGFSESQIGNQSINYHEKVSKLEFKFQPFKFNRVRYVEGLWPKARSGHRIVSNEYNIYTYGGYNPDLMENDPDLSADDNWIRSKPLFREVWQYSLAKRCWSKVPAVNVPYVLASNAVVLQGTVLMVYGGTGVPFGGHCSNTLYVCNLGEEFPVFKEIMVSGDIPEAQYGQAVFVYKQYLYVIGGTTGYDYSCDVHRLDLTSGKWEITCLNRGLPGDPPGRYRHELGLQLLKNKVYIFGGGTAHHSYGFQEVPVYDLERNVWSIIVTIGDPNVTENNGYPMPRRFHSLVQALERNNVFITGGESGSVNVLSDTWKLNLDTLQWTRINSLELRNPRYFHAATLSPQGKMYLFGGICTTGRTDEMLSAWLCIPTLQEMCWEAVIYYNLLDPLPRESKQQLIPPEFLKRLD